MRVIVKPDLRRRDALFPMPPLNSNTCEKQGCLTATFGSDPHEFLSRSISGKAERVPRPLFEHRDCIVRPKLVSILLSVTYGFPPKKRRTSISNSIPSFCKDESPEAAGWLGFFPLVHLENTPGRCAG